MELEILWLILGLAVPAGLLMAFARLVDSALWSSLAGFLAMLIMLAMVVTVVPEFLAVLW
ncbi:hypothetical protein C1I95_31395 [Micromonospora craterilacus]|uniref:Uncharacterized protein n=1 Tax=Micromonospora craterilacus TaxID=1655439 RepID=A0A2W2E116_9ACTN|nr:hypothetical protein [Micromonospora craterilacus]PZG07180.1 hypothetical protein C1I95_31395 [Micromonospora craterilacus]